MLRKIDWENQIGRRLSLRDLHVLLIVAQRGSMAKAAVQLGVSTSTVSEVIANLEGGVGVQLLDRTPQGIQPTAYGRALLKRSVAAFDELKQGIKDIEFLADPTSGELRIGCSDLTVAMFPSMIELFARQYPRVTIRVDGVSSGNIELPKLRERRLDLILARLSGPVSEYQSEDDLNLEVLFYDRLVVAAGTGSRWARRRKVELAELIDEPWILADADGWHHRIVSQAFRSRELNMPRISLITFSIVLRAKMIASGHFIATLPSSAVRLSADLLSLKVLPIDLPAPPWPFAIVTLKHRTLNPVVENFVDHIRRFTRPMRTAQ